MVFDLGEFERIRVVAVSVVAVKGENEWEIHDCQMREGFFHLPSALQTVTQKSEPSDSRETPPSSALKTKSTARSP